MNDATASLSAAEYADQLAKAFFGRKISAEERAEHISANQPHAAMRRSFITSYELQDKLVLLNHLPDEVDFANGETPQLLIAGGRFALEVGRHLRLKSGLPIRVVPNLCRLANAPEHYVRLIADGGTVLLLETPEENGSKVADALRSEGASVLRMQRIVFDGLHPDAIFKPQAEPTISGLLGWHSALVVQGFVTGLSQYACKTLFSEANYQTAGYLGAFDRAGNILRDFDRAIDLRMADAFLDLVRIRSCMCNPREPGRLVHQLYAEHVAAHLGLRMLTVVVESTTDSRVPVWPVYPGLTRHLGFDHGGRLQFSAENESFGLDHLIERAYHIYALWGSERIRAIFAADLANRGMVV